jgi:hypothetical protein
VDEIRKALAEAYLDRIVADNPDLFVEETGIDLEYAVEVVVCDTPGLRISVLFRDARPS